MGAEGEKRIEGGGEEEFTGLQDNEEMRARHEKKRAQGFCSTCKGMTRK